MFVLHIDETNHLAMKDTDYLIDIMHGIYQAMLGKYFLVCLFSGTNAAYLMNLKKTSNFHTVPIHLSPLSSSSLQMILKQLVQKVCKRECEYERVSEGVACVVAWCVHVSVASAGTCGYCRLTN